MRAQLFGRDDDIAALRALLLAAPGIVTVTGPGGVGKTSVVEHAIAGMPLWSRWDGDPVVVDLAGVARADRVLPAIASAVGMSGSAGPSPGALPMAVTAAGPVLVLDNVEHVVAAGPLLRQLADQCPELRLLITSRIPLRLRGERVVELLPLPTPSPEEADPDGPAIALFRAAAAYPGVDHSLTDAAWTTTVARICERLDGIPLAIELAAARAATLGLPEIENLLGRGSHLAVLGRGRADLPDRQRDVTSTITWSHDLLHASARETLAVLSGFTGWFAFEDVPAVCRADEPEPRGGELSDSRALGTCLDDLATLVDAHLVFTRTADTRREYRLPIPVREFCQQQLATAPEGPERHRHLARAHRNRAVTLARSTLLATEGLASGDAFARLATAEGDLARTLDLALAETDTALAAPIAAAVAPALAALWLHRGPHSAQRRVLAEVVDLLTLDTAPPADRAHVQGWLAALDAAACTDDAAAAIVEPALLEAAHLARATTSIDLRLRTLMFVVAAARTVNNFASATAAADEGLALAAKHRRDSWLGRFEAEAGMLAQKVGDDDRAVTLGARALRRGQELQDPRVIVRAVAVLRPPGADPTSPLAPCPSIEEALTIATAADDAAAVQFLLPMAAVDALAHGRLPMAAQRCADGLREAMESGSADYAILSSFVLSGVCLAAGDLATSATLLGLVAPAWPRLRRGLATQTAAAGDAHFELMRRSLGEATYRKLVTSGADRSLRDSLAWALQHASRLAETATAPDAASLPLTPRELTVLRLLSEGLTNKQIAVALGITAKTATHHTTAIYRKLDVRSRTEAAALAHRQGLLSPVE